jgi:DNA-binding transcriptional ArsR family regulator
VSPEPHTLSPSAVEGIFVALGDSTRRNIFFSLMEREQSIKELAGPLGITLTGLGQHIKVLESAQLVSSRKVGRERRCTVDPAGLELLEAFARLQRSLWRSRFDALRQIVEGPQS